MLAWLTCDGRVGCQIARHTAQLYFDLRVELLDSLDSLVLILLVVPMDVLQEDRHECNLERRSGVDMILLGIGEVEKDAQEYPGQSLQHSLCVRNVYMQWPSWPSQSSLQYLWKEASFHCRERNLGSNCMG